MMFTMRERKLTMLALNKAIEELKPQIKNKIDLPGFTARDAFHNFNALQGARRKLAEEHELDLHTDRAIKD